MAAVFALVPSGASATTYTVSPSGDDASPGTQAEPFRTVSRAAEVARAGDTVNVTSGIYAESVRLTSANSGATFRGVGEPRPVIAGGGVRVRGFDNTGASWLAIENFEITGQTTAGIFTAGSHNLIARNMIHHIGSPVVRETQGVRVNRGVGNRVAGNVIHHIGPGSGSIGIWLLESRDGIVEDNVTYLIRKEGMRDWKGLDNTLRRNRSFLNWAGISLGTSTGSTVVDNVAYENTIGIVAKHLSYRRVLDYWGMSVGKWSTVTHNSVFRSTDASVWIAQSGDPLDFLDVRENLFAGAGTAYLRDAPYLRGPNITVDSNSYSAVGGEPRYVYKAGYSSDPGLGNWGLVRSLLGWELTAPPADAGARGVGIAEPTWTPYKMTPVDSSSKGTYYTRTHLDKTSDGIQTTYWLTAGNTNEYVSFDFGQERKFDHLQLTIYSHDDLRNPHHVRFDVWDGSAWRTIHEATNPDPAGSAYYYELDEPVTARYLKMTLIDTFGGDYFVVSDLEAGLLGPAGVTSKPGPAPQPVAPPPAAQPERSDVAPPGSSYPVARRALTLEAHAVKRRRARKVKLKWSGATSRRVEIYRGRSKVRATGNDGMQTMRLGKRARKKRRYRYRVCEAGTSTCSRRVKVTFPR